MREWCWWIVETRRSHCLYLRSAMELDGQRALEVLADE